MGQLLAVPLHTSIILPVKLQQQHRLGIQHAQIV